MAASPTNALTLITGALVALNVLDPTENPDAAQGARGLASLNDLIGQWAIQGLTIPSIERYTQVHTAGKGSPTDPYTVGTGGTINIARPTDISAISIYLTTSTPIVEIPIGQLTSDQWANLPTKTLTSVLETCAFYNPTTALNRGELYLWPVPSGTTYTLVLYLTNELAEFSTLTADYYVGPGYTSALKFQLALEIADDYARPITPNLERMAARAFANIKRQNITLSDMANEFAAIGSQAPAYNIDTGSGG